MSGLTVTLSQPGPIPLEATFDCPRGELLALVGPSGSGKTTILRAIAGLYRPQAGRVTSDGRVLLDTAAGVDLPPQRRRAGVVFQDYALFPHLSALDNVRLALRQVDEPARTERARDWLARTRVAGLELRRPGQLSGGEQQRVALARALARDPAVLLLDEPFSAVDQVTRHRLRLELADLVRTLEVPIVLVTHDLDEACMLADRICVLHRGQTLQQGPPGEVLERPVSAAVARLIDMRNIYQGVVEACDEAGQWLEIGWGDGRIRAAFVAGHPVGAAVTWCIAPTNVLLIPDHARREDGENGFDTEVIGLLSGGALTQAVLKFAGQPGGTQLQMSLPTRVARRHALAVGRALRVSLQRESIHVMPRGRGPRLPGPPPRE